MEVNGATEERRPSFGERKSSLIPGAPGDRKLSSGAAAAAAARKKSMIDDTKLGLTDLKSLLKPGGRKKVRSQLGPQNLNKKNVSNCFICSGTNNRFKIYVC